ncbi:hypothetical protein GQ42DRAFT_176951 [Ramicandelaber brevisporus]|nr:hypothetical protein GQ42DRAFT_176951 [Ramicandelaber brevisporus]
MIPGFVYDPERRRYFRVQTGAAAAASEASASVTPSTTTTLMPPQSTSCSDSVVMFGTNDGQVCSIELDHSKDETQTTSMITPIAHSGIARPPGHSIAQILPFGQRFIYITGHSNPHSSAEQNNGNVRGVASGSAVLGFGSIIRNRDNVNSNNNNDEMDSPNVSIFFEIPNSIYSSVVSPSHRQIAVGMDVVPLMFRMNCVIQFNGHHRSNLVYSVPQTGDCLSERHHYYDSHVGTEKRFI